jgi:hypothetical protein
MRIETVFEANYTFDIPSELPRAGKVLYFPPDKQTGLFEHMIAFTDASHHTWWGVFAARSANENGLHLVSTMPNPDWCLVSSLGTAYSINVQNPSRWDLIAVVPLRCFLVVPERKLLIVGDNTHLVGYGSEGKLWESARLCSDDLKISLLSDEKVEVVGWDAAEDKRVTRNVDLTTGKSR